MREIEFRGKRIDTGEWVYGCYLGCPARPYAVIHQADEAGGSFGFRVDPETVGQFTGHKDKNGVKIFEDDIVKTGAAVLGVFWNEFFFNNTMYHGLEAEVIGNIHDNPELLEGA